MEPRILLLSELGQSGKDAQHQEVSHLSPCPCVCSTTELYSLATGNKVVLRDTADLSAAFPPLGLPLL
jgi:hypothetical protein